MFVKSQLGTLPPPNGVLCPSKKKTAPPISLATVNLTIISGLELRRPGSNCATPGSVSFGKGTHFPVLANPPWASQSWEGKVLGSGSECGSWIHFTTLADILLSLEVLDNEELIRLSCEAQQRLELFRVRETLKCGLPFLGLIGFFFP